MSTHVASGGRHQIAVLEDFAEAARRLHGPEQSHRGFGSGVLEFENPLEILARKASASANQMLYEDLSCHGGIAELKTREGFHHRLIPPEFALIHQASKQQRSHALRIGSCHEERVRINTLRLA